MAAIVGLARAASTAVAEAGRLVERLKELRQQLIDGVCAQVPDAIVNGHPTAHLPGIVHFSFAGCEGDSLLMLLDAQGVACSTGSACDAGVARPSTCLAKVLTTCLLEVRCGHISEAMQAVIDKGTAVERPSCRCHVSLGLMVNEDI